MILILIFAEALGLYGLIIAIILTQWADKESGLTKSLLTIRDILELFKIIVIQEFQSIKKSS